MHKAAATDIEFPRRRGVLHCAANTVERARARKGRCAGVIANAKFTGRAVTVDLAKEALRDLLALQERLVTIENIQRTVAQYFKIRVIDLTSKKRSRSIARPRHIAMALSKDLTNHSLPEIGDAFGGRDHTTVLYACRKIAKLRNQDVTTGRRLHHAGTIPDCVVRKLCTTLRTNVNSREHASEVTDNPQAVHREDRCFTCGFSLPITP